MLVLPSMTATIESILTTIGLSKSQIDSINKGELVKDTVTAQSERELGVYIACQVHAPAGKLKESFLADPKAKRVDETMIGMVLIDLENPEFSEVKLDPTMIQTYLKAAPGSDLNLSKTEIEGFKSIQDASKVEDQFRQVLAERLQAYRDQGLKGMAPYCRKGGKDFFPSDELELWSKNSPKLKEFCPKFYDCFLHYPSAKPEGLEEGFFWVANLLDGKTTVSLMHHFGLREGENYFYAERQFYVSRSHNSVQGLGGAFPDDSGSTTIVYVTRTSTDQVAGFGGSAKKAVGARIMAGRVSDNFEKARAAAKD